MNLSIEEKDYIVDMMTNMSKDCGLMFLADIGLEGWPYPVITRDHKPNRVSFQTYSTTGNHFVQWVHPRTIRFG